MCRKGARRRCQGEGWESEEEMWARGGDGDGDEGAWKGGRGLEALLIYEASTDTKTHSMSRFTRLSALTHSCYIL